MPQKPLEQKREYDQLFKQLRVLRGIAENRHLSIAGNNGNNQIAQLLAGSQAGKVVGLTAWAE
eukprot:TRINITY_DN119_c0_g1_i2.p1 TRINITY_DN119_c0_g1~~TRINITY_DN119_c0_g1_i2.p1  ORF type:complete len:63 (+),score=8.13 TRINITY_DN119_c0_g1_i2:116-304(+)